MPTTPTRNVPLADGGSVAVAVEQPAEDRIVGTITYAGRDFEVIVRRDEGLDGEPATWRGGALELTGGVRAEAAVVSDDANVGFGTADEALDETTRQVVEKAEASDASN